MPLERAIGEYRFAYSSQSSATRMAPPPGAPVLTDFPSYIGQTFENAFGRSGESKRSSATEWISLLGNLEKTLVECRADSSHQHVQGKSCPWCRMEQSSPGFIAFNSNKISTILPLHVDVSQIAAIINAIRDPGSIPDIQTAIVVRTNATPATPTAALISSLRQRAFIGIGASAAGAILIFFGGIAIFPGLIILSAGLVANIGVPKDLKDLREARSQADLAWRGVQDAWAKQPGNKQFLQTKGELNELVRLLTDLPNEERRQVQLLEQRRREAQLHRYLDRFLITDAKIRKIGSGRKAVLASFGVQTAADVNQQRIFSIQGFGPVLIAELMAWRQSVVNKFVFNASEPVNQSDLFALRARIAQRKAELDSKIRASTASLQQTSATSLSQRTRLINLATQTFGARSQAEADEQAATGPLHKASKFISICCAALAAIGLIRGESFVSSGPPQNNPSIVRRLPEVPIPQPQAVPPISTYVPPLIEREPRAPVPPPIDLNSLPPSPPNDVPPPRAVVAPTPPPEQATSEAAVATPNVGADGIVQRQLTETDGATDVQQRLIELGYLSAAADGKWGPLSKRALVEFKQRAGLENSDSWDADTERALFSDGAPHAAGVGFGVVGLALELRAHQIEQVFRPRQTAAMRG